MSKYIFFLAIIVLATPAWAAFPSGWERKCSLTVQHAQVSADQVNFPVLVGYYATSNNETNLPDEMVQTGNSNAAQSDGGDIRFTLDAEGTTPLHYEIVVFAQNATLSNARAEIWVKLPNIYSATDVTFYVWYHYAGGGQSTPSASDATWGSRGVWDASYQGVWHMPDGTSLTVSDSTGQHDGAVNGAVSVAAGRIDGGADLAGTSGNYISTQTNFPDITSVVSVSCWVKPGASQITYADIFGNHNEPFSGLVFQQDAGSLNKYYFAYGNGTNWTSTSDVQLVTGTWQYLVAVKTAAKFIIYLNGVNSAETNDTSSIMPSSINFKFGEGYHNGERSFNGSMDEGRVSNAVRSAEWIMTEYNNQSAPQNFIVRGSVQSNLSSLTGLSSITGVSSIMY